MSMLFKILFFWLPSKKVKPAKPTPKKSVPTKRTRKKK
tara:strand:+ start:281 stop:394 length:114 start_codon:yes stop_codon:yes gene_type:complete